MQVYYVSMEVYYIDKVYKQARVYRKSGNVRG